MRRVAVILGMRTTSGPGGLYPKALCGLTRLYSLLQYAISIFASCKMLLANSKYGIGNRKCNGGE
jgi:hypothetical protein